MEEVHHRIDLVMQVKDKLEGSQLLICNLLTHGQPNITKKLGSKKSFIRKNQSKNKCSKILKAFKWQVYLLLVMYQIQLLIKVKLSTSIVKIVILKQKLWRKNKKLELMVKVYHRIRNGDPLGLVLDCYLLIGLKLDQVSVSKINTSLPHLQQANLTWLPTRN